MTVKKKNKKQKTKNWLIVCVCAYLVGEMIIRKHIAQVGLAWFLCNSNQTFLRLNDDNHHHHHHHHHHQTVTATIAFSGETTNNTWPKKKKKNKNKKIPKPEKKPKPEDDR